MPPTTPLPEFFGRLTTVLHQHEHLGHTLGKLRTMCDFLEVGRRLESVGIDPPKLLAAWRGDLAQHFVAEESDAHFGMMAEERPRLLPAIVDLKADHAAVLAAIDALLIIATDEARWPELVVPTRRLIRSLEVHERAEALLLHEYFAPSENSPLAPSSSRSELGP
jgi:hypothetical protein